MTSAFKMRIVWRNVGVSEGNLAITSLVPV